MVRKSTFEAFSLRGPDGSYYLRPDRVLGCFLINRRTLLSASRRASRSNSANNCLTDAYCSDLARLGLLERLREEQEIEWDSRCRILRDQQNAQYSQWNRRSFLSLSYAPQPPPMGAPHHHHPSLVSTTMGLSKLMEAYTNNGNNNNDDDGDDGDVEMH
jgi:hypothetical protein